MKSKLPHVGTTIFTVMSKLNEVRREAGLAAECGAINLIQGFTFGPCV
ncbi:MAG: hypothetical protein IPL52_05770 [Flavobacteriales bacterium]|nr:hypothetical protein [Flavobacteriales bacterium]